MQQIVQNAIANPKQFVVKPQKEGGGNNFYDDDAKALLMEFIDPSTDSERKESLK